MFPNITVEVVSVPDGTSYDDHLNTLAAARNVPDVFMWGNVPDAVARGWAFKSNDLALNDPEYFLVTQAIREGGLINGNVYGLPAAMFIQGLAVNYDIFDELNLDPLPYTYTLDDLRQALADTTTSQTKGTDNFSIESWGTFVLNENIGFRTWDGEKFNFSSPEFAEIIEFMQEVVARRQTGHGGLNVGDDWLPEGAGWPWGTGFIAMQFEGSWQVNDWINHDSLFQFKVDMLPLPNERVIVIPDYIFIGASTPHPREAYELVKWMTYGLAGMTTRIELSIEHNRGGFNGVPLTAGNHPEIDAFFLQMYDSLPNFIRLYHSLATHPQNALLEPMKSVPGFRMSAFDVNTGVIGTLPHGDEVSFTMGQLIESIIRGERALADYAAEMDRIANQEYERAVEAVKDR
jgi:multiple sugar transport system substrate-binding protein